jgi:hypothetical protein
LLPRTDPATYQSLTTKPLTFKLTSSSNQYVLVLTRQMRNNAIEQLTPLSSANIRIVPDPTQSWYDDQIGLTSETDCISIKASTRLSLEITIAIASAIATTSAALVSHDAFLTARVKFHTSSTGSKSIRWSVWP